MASEVSTAGAQQDLRRRVAELERELGEAHQREAATAELLEVINRPRFALQSVFDAIAQSAVRLCEAEFAFVFRFDGERISAAASYGLTPEGVAAWRKEYPRPAGEDTAIGRAILQRAVVQIADVQADPAFGLADLAQRATYRSLMAVPFLREGHPTGGIAVGRAQAGVFPKGQIRLLRSFADQAVIAIENTRLFEAVQARTRELTKALEQQRATADVLKVISRSALDLQRVLDALVESAAHLCDAYDAAIFQVFGEDLRLVAHHGQIPTPGPVGEHTLPLVRGLISGRAILDRETIQVADTAAETDEYPESQKIALRLGYRTALGVPLIHADKAIGAILIRRTEVRQFTDRQIDLLKTFADQAVIAIENTRLFEAEQASKRELQESLEYQTAISEVLGAISRTPTELQPMLAEICKTANRLCETPDAAIFLWDGKWLRVGSVQGSIGAGAADKIPLNRGFVAARAFLDREVVHVHDLRAAAGEYPEGYESSLKLGHRTIIGVPLLRNEDAIGVLILRRSEVKPFTDKQIRVLKTFADQAVIAIENTRLFEAEKTRTKEVEAKSAELRESLEYQTATSEVLSVISRSPNDVQPVLDTIARIAQRLCQAEHAFVLQRGEGGYRLVAANDAVPDWVTALKANPLPPDRGSLTGRVALERRTVHVDDLRADPEYTLGPTLQRGVRSELAVPLMRDGEVIGVIIVGRTEVRPFTKRQIALVETFADQAVIAIENTRLFEAEQASKRELQESLEYQTGISDVLGAISSSKFDLQPIIDTIVETAVRLCQAERGAFLRFERDGFRFVPTTRRGSGPISQAILGRLIAFDRGSIAGRVALERAIVHVHDIQAEPEITLLRGIEGDTRRTALGVPLLSADRALGAIVLQRTEVRPFTLQQIKLIETFADQAVIAIENTRLFEEVQARTNELAKTVEDLEIASHHKSQFVANMSHELRTPLAAILGYAELMQEGFYEPQGPKSLDALTRIRSNGKHLLGLINTVLDIAKIESGQFTLNMAEYAIESVVETVRSATESLAQNKKLSLKTDVTKPLPIGLGDEQRLTQVLLNLVGNAIKFTDSGEVRVTAKAINGHINITVADTGPGIPPAEQTRIFDQFHQVDSSNTKAKGGTGLGLAIAKQIVEMHGGRIWVESTLGKGSTFQMEIPTHAEFPKRGS